MHSGGMNALTEETIRAMNEWAEKSDGIKAVLGILTDENMQEYAMIGENGELIEKNNRNAYSIFISNCSVLGPTLSKFAMKLGDSGFPAELYGDAVGTLLTIVQNAEERNLSGEENIYESYIQNNQNSKGVMALVDAFGFCKELFTEQNGLGEVMNAAIRDAQLRCQRGMGTEQDYALVHAFAPELTKEEMYEDESYIELLQEIKTGRSFSDRPYDPENPDAEKEWYDTQALRYIAEKGYDCDLDSVVGMQVKDMLMDFKIGALNQMKETAAKLGYKTIGEYMEKTGVTMETIDEIAKYDLRWFEEHVANEETVKNVRDFVYQGDGTVGTLEILGKGAVTGVSEYFAEVAEAVYTWLESMNVPADTARAKALYTGEYGRFSGERELYNQLMEMCEEGYFPNDEMNGFVKRYLQAGGSPFEPGIVPGDFGFVVEVENTLGAPAEEFREWSKESLTEEQAAAFNATAAFAKAGVGIAVEAAVGKAIPNIPGYQKIVDKGSDAMAAMGKAAKKRLPGHLADDAQTVLKAIDNLWGDGALAKGMAFTVSEGAQAYNDGVSAGLADDRSIGKSGTIGLANYTTALLNQYFSPGKAALELAVNGMPENQTMGFVAAMANASGESAHKTINAATEAAEEIGSIIGGAMKTSGEKKQKNKVVQLAGETAATPGKGIIGAGNEALQVIGPIVQKAGKWIKGNDDKNRMTAIEKVEKWAEDRIEEEFVSIATISGMSTILGKPDGVPDYGLMPDKKEKDFEKMSPIEQFREVGRRLSCLGL